MFPTYIPNAIEPFVIISGHHGGSGMPAPAIACSPTNANPLFIFGDGEDEEEETGDDGGMKNMRTLLSATKIEYGVRTCS